MQMTFCSFMSEDFLESKGSTIVRLSHFFFQTGFPADFHVAGKRTGRNNFGLPQSVSLSKFSFFSFDGVRYMQDVDELARLYFLTDNFVLSSSVNFI